MTHGDDFVGPEIPFGAAVIFVPAESKKSGHLHKWGPTGRLGVFAGYDLQPGSTWTGGGVLVWDLAEFEGVPLLQEAQYMKHSLQFPHKTRRVQLADNDITFPLRHRYRITNYTLERREEAKRLEGLPHNAEDDDRSIMSADSAVSMTPFNRIKSNLMMIRRPLLVETL